MSEFREGARYERVEKIEKNRVMTANVDKDGSSLLSGWRQVLRQFAEGRWQEVLTALNTAETIRKADESEISPFLVDLGSRAEEAFRIVDRFSIGAAAEAFSSGGVAATQPGHEFHRQLDTILNGLAQSVRSEEQDGPFAGSRIFQSELWQVLHKVRESAELSYAREIDIVELDRRILFLLKSQGPLVPADLSAAIGVDKAQVSRSVKRLLELKMIDRKQIRNPLILTRKGDTLATRLLRLAELRNRELTFDVTDKELKEFFGTIEVLLDRAVTLYERERERAVRGADDLDSQDGIGPVPNRTNEPMVMDRSRIVSPMLTLLTYFSRSGGLAYKRTTGLSNFEAWVLNEIGRSPPTDWPTLVKALQRDHSQASRTVNHLIEKGLVVREGKPGRRHGLFSPTAEGKRLHGIIEATGVKRSDFLLEPLTNVQLEAFMSIFDKIRRNAAAQLERERAFEELEHA